MQLEFELSKEDYREAVRLHRRNNPDESDPPQLLNYVGFATTALGFLLLTVRPDGGGRFAPIVLIVVGLFIPLRQKSVMFTEIKKSWAETERLLQPMIWKFGVTVQVSSSLYQVTYEWGCFIRSVEGPSVLLLYQTGRQYRVIPKRAFESEAQLVQFRQLLTEKIVPPAVGFQIIPRS
jgi:hypothetical protein